LLRFSRHMKAGGTNVEAARPCSRCKCFFITMCLIISYMIGMALFHYTLSTCTDCTSTSINQFRLADFLASSPNPNESVRASSSADSVETQSSESSAREPSVEQKEGMSAETTLSTGESVSTLDVKGATTATNSPEFNHNPENRSKYGFYIHCFEHPAAVLYQVRKIKEYFPGSPIYLMSDGGMDFTRLCKKEGCQFVLCPPANDRWHPWPFFRRFYDAAVALNAEYIIMLEPDVTLHGPVTRDPEYDAGGIHVPKRWFDKMDGYFENLGRKRNPNYVWKREYMELGLAGGSYFKRETLLDAFNDQAIMTLDWNRMWAELGKNVFSSDFAMPYVLAARGWTMGTWKDLAQMGTHSRDVPDTGAQDAAFRHYSRGYPGGKPTYLMSLAHTDQDVYAPQPSKYKKHNANCQMCYDEDKYVRNWGSKRCTNGLPFKYLKRWSPIFG